MNTEIWKLQQPRRTKGYRPQKVYLSPDQKIPSGLVVTNAIAWVTGGAVPRQVPEHCARWHTVVEIMLRLFSCSTLSGKGEDAAGLGEWIEMESGCAISENCSTDRESVLRRHHATIRSSSPSRVVDTLTDQWSSPLTTMRSIWSRNLTILIRCDTLKMINAS